VRLRQGVGDHLEESLQTAAEAVARLLRRKPHRHERRAKPVERRDHVGRKLDDALDALLPDRLAHFLADGRRGEQVQIQLAVPNGAP